MLSAGIAEKQNVRSEGGNKQLYILASTSYIFKVGGKKRCSGSRQVRSCVVHKQIRPNKSK